MSYNVAYPELGLLNHSVHQTSWLSHSTSSVSSSNLISQEVDEVMSYDKKSLDAALTLMDSPYINNAIIDSSNDP